MILTRCASAVLLLLAVSAHPHAARAGDQPDSRDIHVPAFTLPPSPYLSPQAIQSLRDGLGPEGAPLDEQIRKGEIPPLRAAIGKDGRAAAQRIADREGLVIEEAMLGGIHGYWVRSKRTSMAAPVLLNLPSGGFLVGSAAGSGLAESIPLVARTGFVVFTMDYRQAPEHTFPAASEDAAAVYRALLAQHRPTAIGIYGCSSGGLLTAQALAWFQRERLPVPGAAAILCASADARWAGDSWSWQKPLRELTSPPSLDERFYYGAAKFDDPLLSPIVSDAVLAKFPPTLLLTGTRAPELSAAANTHRLLIRSGVDARLHVWDGLGHAFLTNPALPESSEAWDAVARFFKAQLGRRSR